MSESLVALSGSSSEIGKAVASELRNRGYTVHALTRRNAEEGQEFDLNSSSPVDYPPKCIALIHIAWDWGANPDKNRQINVENASKKIFEHKSSEIKTVLLSTMSVYSKSVSNYGSAKFELEKAFLNNNGSVVRAGIVFGGANTGILAQLKKISRLPICIHVGSYKNFHFSDLAGLAKALVDEVSKPNPSVSEYITKEKNSLHEILNLIDPTIKRIHFFVWPKAIELVSKSLRPFARVLPFRTDSLSALLPTRGQLGGPKPNLFESKAPKRL